jgi:amino acid transporter
MVGVNPIEPSPKPGLRRSYLSLFEVVGQSVGGIAPTVTPALILPLVFASAGNASWAAMAFATVALLFLAAQMKVFGRRVASPGALYVYAAEGLGSFAGIVSGLALTLAYLFDVVAILAGFANELAILLRSLGLDPGPFGSAGLVLAIAVAAGILSYRDVKVSTRVCSSIEFLTMAVVLLLIGAFFLRDGTVVDPDQLSFRNTTPDQFRQGLVLAFFSFVGFETAADLGTEARNPLKAIPRALVTSIALSGAFFIVSAYGLVAAFHDVIPPLDKQDAPLTTLAASLGFDGIGLYIPLAIAVSLFAAGVAILNAGSRVIYSLAHRGVFHSRASMAHATHATPHIALLALVLVSLVIVAGLSAGGVSLLDIFGYAGTLSTFGLIVAYIGVAVAAPVYLKKQGRLRLWNALSALITLILLLVALAGNLYPVPDWPSNILPYIFAGLLMLGVAYFLYLRKKDPDRLLAVEKELLRMEAS